eukprot:m.80429 g.80429  ORF g.80429 m.80429 type:complete len:426 (+) comp12758_c0_seq2:84-1361(+)
MATARDKLVLLGVIMFGGFLFTKMFSMHTVNEWLESTWRDSPAHDMINDLANNTMSHFHRATEDTTIFVHVPRTGGDSLRTHLFPSDDIYVCGSASCWWGVDGASRFYEDLHNSSELSNWTKHKRLYQGFISRDDIMALKTGPWKIPWKQGHVKMFTILRHPHERVFSLFKHLRKYTVNATVNGTERKFYKNVNEFLSTGCVEGNSGWQKYKSFSHNGMAYQLGSHLLPRKRNDFISEEQVVRQAKALLDEMDFIGFYEDWDMDYYDLYELLFIQYYQDSQEDSCTGYLSCWTLSFLKYIRFKMFLWGTMIVRGRMKTLKYSSSAAMVDLEAVMNVTRLDMEVYRYARQLKQRSLDGSLHTSYAKYVGSSLPRYILLIAVIFLLWRLCSRRCECCGYCFCCCCWFPNRRRRYRKQNLPLLVSSTK